MYKKRSNIFIIITISLLMIVTACNNSQTNLDVESISEPPALKNDLNSVTLIITKEYGREVLFNKQVKFNKNWTVYDILEANTEITTDYGGSFISGINGFESNSKGTSGARLDWFYYVNGICCDVGALDYDLSAGDVIWWDYHTWKSMDSSNSTVIGSYPEPFIHGYRGKVGQTTIMCLEAKVSLAKKLEQSLKDKGIKSVVVEELDSNKIEDREGPLIIIGEWKELNNLDYINKFNEYYKKNGTYIHFIDNGLEILTEENEISRTLKEQAGVIISHGDGLGDDCPLWFIIGIDENGLKQAVNVLVNNSEHILNSYSAVIDSNEIIKLPFK